MKNLSIIAIAILLASCGSNANKQAQIAAQRSVDSMKTEMVKQKTIDSMNAITSQPPVNDQVAASPVHTAVHHSSSTTNNYTSNTTNNTTASAANAAPKKKGWSAKAKGAVIGTGVGAITGAMIDRRKGEGAVVGGILGAGAGLGTGAIIDSKNKDK
jgi:hypothetical protein